ncbi:MAG TPA: hypothetical protein VHP57_09355, partial [Acidimicrobiia bacterium]|nr:hypothetical protein [Acidimicrobiia bacterium]
LLRALRDALLVTAAAGKVKIAAPEEERVALAGLGESMGTGAMVRALETLGQAVVDMRGVGAPDPRLVLEVAVVRLARRDAASSLHALAERIDRLEHGLSAIREGGGPTRSTSPTPAVPSTATGPPATGSTATGPSGPARTLGALRKEAATEPTVPTPSPNPEPTAAQSRAPEPTPPAVIESTGPIDLDDLVIAWAELLPAMSPATRAAVQEAQPIALEGDVVVFGVPARLHEAAKPRFQKEAATIRAALAQRVGRTLRFRIVVHDFAGSGAPAARRPSSVASSTPDRRLEAVQRRASSARAMTLPMASCSTRKPS